MSFPVGKYKHFSTWCKAPKTANVSIYPPLPVRFFHSCDSFNLVMLPENVPAVLHALPEEDRLETAERYFLTFAF